MSTTGLSFTGALSPTINFSTNQTAGIIFDSYGNVFWNTTGAFDWSIRKVSAGTVVFDVFQSGVVKTQNNQLDDGSGAVTIAGATIVNNTLWVNETSTKALQISDGSSNVSFNVDTGTPLVTVNTNFIQNGARTFTTGTGVVQLLGATTCLNTSKVQYTSTSAFAVTDTGGGISFSVDTSGANIAINATTLVTDKAFIIQNNLTKGFYVNDHTGASTIFNVDTVADKVTVQGIYAQFGTSTTAFVA